MHKFNRHLYRSFAFASAVLLPVTHGWASYPCGSGLVRANRASHTATLLTGGNILLAGGTIYGQVSGSAEVVDPTSGDFVAFPATAMAVPRTGHNSTLLTDGKVLITGGYTVPAGYSAAAEIFDPTSNSFSVRPPMHSARWGHSTTLLQDGRVLVAGGRNDASAQSSAEIFDPLTNSFTLLANSMNSRRYEHTATLLSDGRVLIAGGNAWNGTGGNVLISSAEIFDPVAQTFTAVGAMSTPRDTATGTLLPSGAVLVAGGNSSGGVGGELATAEIFDPASGKFTLVSAHLSSARSNHTATLLPTGEVLLAGGIKAGVYMNLAEIFDPRSGTFSALPPMLGAAVPPRATALPNGAVYFDEPVNADETFDLTSRSFALVYRPLICSVSGASSVLTIQGVGISGRPVDIETSSDPTDGFVKVTTITPAADGQFFYRAYFPAVSRQFYRAVVH